MRLLRQALLTLVLLSSSFLPLSADSFPRPDTPIEDAIDHYVNASLRRAEIRPAPQASTPNLIRRLTLDLAGRIPASIEVKRFIQSDSPHRRTELVDRLIASPEFDNYMAARFDWVITQGNGSIREYLQVAWEQRLGWDDIFRDILLADLNDATSMQALEFLKKRVNDTDQLTNEVSVIFFGVNISCAKCHDHPLVPDWVQDHFYGMKSFFSRTFDNGGFVAERDYGFVKYKTTAGDERQAKLMFLTGEVFDGLLIGEPTDEQRKKWDRKLAECKKKKQRPPPPVSSLRRILVDIALEDRQNYFFAKAIVNRLWYQFLGRGLVMPVDQMHLENPPSHPELLDSLARDLIQHDYDLRRLIRGMVMSQTYSRSSRWEGDQQRPAADLFAVAMTRPLTPTQMARSLRLATADLDDLPRPDRSDVELQKRIRDVARSDQAAPFVQPGDNFQVPVSESLWFNNSEQFQRDYLTGGLAERLQQMEDRGKIIEKAIWNVLSRAPQQQEIDTLLDYLAQHEDRPEKACQQLLWALLASSEFRFNY